ncbi:hypothetical protein WJX73_008855 [Symbiochloris irregularis]|uniref:RNA polymerase II C-terminal domain phosphatase-like n=1 Tax=Symbiochloris irregularis TaxID=706552 RepID=A0AAW1P8Q1_9CHLO
MSERDLNALDAAPASPLHSEDGSGVDPSLADELDALLDGENGTEASASEATAGQQSAQAEPEQGSHAAAAGADAGTATSEPTSRKRTADEEATGHESSLKRLKGDDGAESAPICPPHPGLMHGMCIRCGTLVTQEPQQEDGLALRYIHDRLQLSQSEAARLRQRELKRVIASRRLLLVLDLDHTLLNSTREVELSPELRETLSGMATDQEDLHHLPHMGMWTKLRPGSAAFLQKCAPLFEMCIYTHGDREYAVAMAQLLDPGGSYFGNHIISQGDSTHIHVKDLDVVLGDDTAVLIVDDTPGVWPNHARNLIQAERYIYFPADAVRWETVQRALLERGCDESADDNCLHGIGEVLVKVHARAFPCVEHQANGSASARVDVREHLSAVAHTVLAGCTIVFSRIFPMDLAFPEQHRLWQLAVQLGAVVSKVTDASTTHVVAGGDRTDKVLWAKRHRVHAVSPAWLHASGLHWRKADEAKFPVAGDALSSPQRRAAEGVGDRSIEEDAAIAAAAAGGGGGAPQAPHA